MMEWQTIDTAPKKGSFLATDGVLLGIGSHYRHVEPETVLNMDKWHAYYKEIHRPFMVKFTVNGLFPPGFDYLANCKAESEAWDKAKSAAPDYEYVPNPNFGEVREWYYASAAYAYDNSPTGDYDGPIGFSPTHWAPLLSKPVPVKTKRKGKR